MIENIIRTPHEVFNCKVTITSAPSSLTFTAGPTHQSAFSTTSPLVIRWADGTVSTTTTSTMSLTIAGDEDTFGYENVSSVAMQLAFIKSTGGTVSLALGLADELVSGRTTTAVATTRNSVASAGSVTISQVSDILLTITMSKQGGTWSVIGTK